MANPNLRGELRELLEKVHLERHLDAVCTWAEDNGAHDAYELASEEVFDDLAADIGLKRLESKRLKAEFAKLVPQETSPDSPASPVDTLKLRQALSHPGCWVRTTVLPASLPTALTEESNVCDDEDEVAPNHEGSSETAVSANSPDQLLAATPSSSAQVMAADLKRFETYNPFEDGALTNIKTYNALEDSAYWNWQDGDPNKMCAAAPAAAPVPENQSFCPMLPEQPFMADEHLTPGSGQFMPMIPLPLGMYPYGWMPMMDPGGYSGMPNTSIIENATAPAAEPKSRAQVMERVFSGAGQRERIHWTVDSRLLKTTDREAVSPTFNVACGGTLEFKMVLKPKVQDTTKGGSSFKKSRGKGYIELRCVSVIEPDDSTIRPILTFRLGLTSDKKTEPFRGPVRHNFSERAIGGLPEGQAEWDFHKVVDHSNHTFAVVLELLKDDS